MTDHLDYEFRNDLKLDTKFCEDLWLEIVFRKSEKQIDKLNDDSLIIWGYL